MAEVLDRLGYRLRPVVKAKPQKKIQQTDEIFAKKDGQPVKEDSDGGDSPP